MTKVQQTDLLMKKSLEGLRYIAASPPQEYGGFHPETVRIAKAALRLIARLIREKKP